MSGRMSLRAFVDSGLLHEVNEAVLWDLGVALVANVSAGTLRVITEDAPIVSALDPKAHDARHAALEAFRASRTPATPGGPLRPLRGRTAPVAPAPPKAPAKPAGKKPRRA